MPSKKRPATSTLPKAQTQTQLQPTEPSTNEIATRAYQRWVARGQPLSDGREDWFAAEAELRAEQKPAPSPARRRPIRSALRRLGI